MHIHQNVRDVPRNILRNNLRATETRLLPSFTAAIYQQERYHPKYLVVEVQIL